MPWGREKFAKGDDDMPPPRPITVFGLDLYLVGFIAVGGGLVLLGVYWLFFTRLPIPVYCRSYTRYVQACGSVSRDPAPAKPEGPAKPPGSPQRPVAAS
jgi:hypothetical protein